MFLSVLWEKVYVCERGTLQKHYIAKRIDMVFRKPLERWSADGVKRALIAKFHKSRASL